MTRSPSSSRPVTYHLKASQISAALRAGSTEAFTQNTSLRSIEVSPECFASEIQAQEFFAAIGQLPNLKKLFCKKSLTARQCAIIFPLLPNVKDIRMTIRRSLSEHTDEHFGELLCGMSNLETCSLRGDFYPLNTSALAPLQFHPSLREIKLQYFTVNDENWDFCCGPALERLDLNHGVTLGPQAASSLGERLATNACRASYLILGHGNRAIFAADLRTNTHLTRLSSGLWSEDAALCFSQLPTSLVDLNVSVGGGPLSSEGSRALCSLFDGLQSLVLLYTEITQPEDIDGLEESILDMLSCLATNDTLKVFDVTSTFQVLEILKRYWELMVPATRPLIDRNQTLTEFCFFEMGGLEHLMKALNQDLNRREPVDDWIEGLARISWCPSAVFHVLQNYPEARDCFCSRLCLRLDLSSSRPAGASLGWKITAFDSIEGSPVCLYTIVRP